MDAAADPSDTIPVGEYPSLGLAQEHALVILAMNLSCWLGRSPESGYVLLADPDRAPAIAAELAAYEAEQGDAAPSAPQPLPSYGAGPWLALLWAVLLMGGYLLQGKVAGSTAAGASSSAAIFDHGQWWRAFTALFLHGDLEHLFGNIVSGIAFGTLACRSLGRATAWPLIFLSGTLGNLATAYLHYPDPSSSIGASTAVFGALGLLTGHGFYLAFRLPASAPWASVIVPLGGGIALLGWLGAGGPRTDVLAHLMGFLCGAALALPISWRRLRHLAEPRGTRPAAGGRWRSAR